LVLRQRACKRKQLRHACDPTSPATITTQARSAVAAISNEASVVPYFPHAIQDTLLQLLPQWLLSYYLVRLHKGLRARFMKKLRDESTSVTAARTAAEPVAAASASGSGGGVRSASKKAQ